MNFNIILIVVISSFQIASSSIAIKNINKDSGSFTNQQKHERAFLIFMLIVSTIAIIGSIIHAAMQLKK